MTVQPEEAAGRLHDLAATQKRSATLFRYQQSSPHLILWGVLWIAGYTASFFVPKVWFTWPLLCVVGVALNFWIGRAQSRARETSHSGQYGASLLTVVLFVAGLFTILPPHTGNQAGAFFPLLVAMFYALQGIWSHTVRIAVLGFALGALTITGYLLLPHIFLLWMAAVGGGGLILGGFWLRTV